MATEIYNADSSDLDGTDVDVQSLVDDKGSNKTYLYVNKTDVSLTVTPKLTHRHDADLSEAYTATAQTLSTGTNGRDVLNTDAWEQVGFTFSFSGNPSSGSVKIYEMSERD